MTNPKQTSGQTSTDARSITEQDINRRVAEALGWEYVPTKHAPNYGRWFFDEKYVMSEPYWKPLTDEVQLCRLLMDNWEGITRKLDYWLSGYYDGDTFVGEINPADTIIDWWENPELLANKELWILRALVAYKESQK